ncbi:hypothetical protein H2199_006883 [Coniosporium tulheliwenetii]|uniref:Uncharacterized protein n=1 Tax=Coniosporium tulheliwenetii TaxID=3383036 RepID=A0ACC2YSJ7_9PEZI|nr:hypothetical protein H2199_006883 [Cladosporium sp. JES 115]
MARHDFQLSAPAQSEAVELAAEEGHDTDIPSNLGIIKGPGAEDFNKEIDIEKCELSPRTSQSSPIDETGVPAEAADPNIIGWNGDDDPENPLNWPSSKRWGTVAIVSAFTFLTPLGSAMFAPGVPQIMEEFGSSSELLAGFVVSVYVLGFAFGPLVVAPLSEITNLDMLIAFRFFAGSVGSAPLALGGGSIADTISREQRGTAMALWMSGPTVGPIIAGVITVAGMVLMKETYGLAILNHRVARLKKETGNLNLKSSLDSGLSPKDLFLYSIVRPSKMLFTSPIVFLLSLYVAVAYAYLYILFSTFTSIFVSSYGFSTGAAGLTFLGLGIGSVIGQVLTTVWGNRTVQKHIRKGDFEPEHRLPLMYPGAVAMPIGLFWYGWSAEFQTHWIVPIVGTGIVGFGLLMLFMAPNTYLVDVFTLHAASAMAACTVMRSVFAAVLPLGGQKLYNALGLGWGNSLLGFIATALIPIPFLFVKYGKKIRTKYPVNL